MSIIFTPKHYQAETWKQYEQRGFRLCRYLALPAKQIAAFDAETFLIQGRDIFFTSLLEHGHQDSCILAKIFSPDGRAVCLRTDRDYFEVYIRDAEGTDTATCWQFAYTLRGYRQDELWSNMVDFL